jgi:hypothetical protein
MTDKVLNAKDFFGKNYQPRRGASFNDGCSQKASDFNYKPQAPRDLTEPHRIRRRGAIRQPEPEFNFSFERMAADNILKYGTKVHIDDSQLKHTYTDENGQSQTKKLSELSFDVSTKLSELQKITALGSNVPLDDKMNVLNTMINEIRGKFALLSGLDMKNISQIIKYMGDEMKKARDLQLPDYLTQKGFETEVLDNEARLTLWLAKQFNTYGYMATHGLARTKLTTNQELADFIRNDPRVLYNTYTLEITVGDWTKVGDDMKLPKNSGKLIDGFEYDAHPQTNALNAAKAQRVADEVSRIEKKQQEQKDRDNKEQEKIEKKEQKEQKERKKQEDKRQLALEPRAEKERMLKAFNDRMLENITKRPERKQEQKKQIKKISDDKAAKKLNEKKGDRRLQLSLLDLDIKTAKAYVSKVENRMGNPPTDRGRKALKKANETLAKLMEQKNNI